MTGHPDPRRTYNHKELDPPFQHLLAAYKNEDPRLQLELPVPVEVVASARLQDGMEKSRTIGDLVELHFFFCYVLVNICFQLKKTENEDSSIQKEGCRVLQRNEKDRT